MKQETKRHNNLLFRCCSKDSEERLYGLKVITTHSIEPLIGLTVKVDALRTAQCRKSNSSRT